jgi:hypothetical protein
MNLLIVLTPVYFPYAIICSQQQFFDIFSHLFFDFFNERFMHAYNQIYEHIKLTYKQRQKQIIKIFEMFANKNMKQKIHQRQQ